MVGEKSPLRSLTCEKGEETAQASVIAWLRQLFDTILTGMIAERSEALFRLTSVDLLM